MDDEGAGHAAESPGDAAGPAPRTDGAAKEAGGRGWWIVLAVLALLVFIAVAALDGA